MAPTKSATPHSLSASITTSATPAAVWSLLRDVRRMADFSPELRAVLPLGRTRGLGSTFLGVNRRGLLVWPTTSRVVRWEPDRAIAWKTRESGATWVYEWTAVDEGTRITASRVLPAYSMGTVVLGPLLGGAESHDRELQDGLGATLERIRARLER